MHHFSIRPVLLGGVAVLSLGTALTAQAAEVEVIHWWTSGGEQAAVTVFADEFEALGDDVWIDTAIAGGENSRAATMQRILGGDPPEAAQFNISRQFEDLAEAGLLLDLTDLAEEEGWRDFIRPSAILDVCEFDGRIYCVPVNIHSWQWAWVSIPVFEQAGVEIPSTIEGFLEVAPAIQEAGFIPFAMGGESWQQSGAFGVLMLNMLGRDMHYALYRDRDAQAARSAEVREVFEVFRSLKEFTDEGGANRNWSLTTNLVIQDQAGLQIMGDWARGEFSLAGEVAGQDYDCLPGPSEDPYLQVGGDVFLFPAQDDPDVEAAQLRLASMMVNPQVQVLFNNQKGSLPVRDDVDTTLLTDVCMIKGLEILRDPDSVVENAEIFLSADTNGQMQDLFAEFWTNPDLSIDDAQERFAQILEAAD